MFSDKFATVKAQSGQQLDLRLSCRFGRKVPMNPYARFGVYIGPNYPDLDLIFGMTGDLTPSSIFLDNVLFSRHSGGPVLSLDKSQIYAI